MRFEPVGNQVAPLMPLLYHSAAGCQGVNFVFLKEERRGLVTPEQLLAIRGQPTSPRTTTSGHCRVNPRKRLGLADIPIV